MLINKTETELHGFSSQNKASKEKGGGNQSLDLSKYCCSCMNYMWRSDHKHFIRLYKNMHLCALCVLAKKRADESRGSEIVWRLVIKAPLGVWSVIYRVKQALCAGPCSVLLHPLRLCLYAQIGSRLMNTNSLCTARHVPQHFYIATRLNKYE